MIRSVIQLIFKLPENPLKEALRRIYYGDIISERIIEYALVFKYLGIDSGKILDVGCYYSSLPLQLASMGFKVYAIDPEKYQLKHPGLKFIQGDIQNSSFKNNFFDIVTVVSTIEHIGLGYYKDNKYNDGDKRAILEIKRILKDKGRLLMSVPYCKKHRVTGSQRMYDRKSLDELLTPEFRVIKKSLFRLVDDKWRRTVEKDIPIVKGSVTKAIAFIIAEKK